ncbi:hypothetical protein JTB14_008402 [Gonioctena quinquepunctata]|nr:hypothetical protein JTB14_008402 [Gonioctena quinquepunctata]
MIQMLRTYGKIQIEIEPIQQCSRPFQIENDNTYNLTCNCRIFKELNPSETYISFIECSCSCVQIKGLLSNKVRRRALGRYLSQNPFEKSTR